MPTKIKKNKIMKKIKLILRQVLLVASLFNVYSCSGQGSQISAPEAFDESPVSFYTLSATLNNGDTLEFSSLKGKKVLIVNTASKCGYTGQYDGLEKLYEKYKDQLVIIAFPANDFMNQEKGTDEEIAQFCKLNYGVTFPIAKKAGVIKNTKQQEVFKWLTDKKLNGWNDQAPKWNFSKYLISEDGKLLNYFKSSVDPMDEKIIQAIEE